MQSPSGAPTSPASSCERPTEFCRLRPERIFLLIANRAARLLGPSWFTNSNSPCSRRLRMGSRVVCDECGARYSLSDEAVGRRLHCRECGASVEPVAKPVKRKRRGAEVDLTLRIFGIGAMLLTIL